MLLIKGHDLARERNSISSVFIYIAAFLSDGMGSMADMYNYKLYPLDCI